MDLEDIRRLIVTAVCSDDVLLDTLVLKGGNALRLIHGIGDRTSVDIDFSMAEDFTNLNEAKARLFRALKERFDTKGYVVFDEELRPKPSEPSVPTWGGYLVEFKLVPRERYLALGGRVEDLRRQAEAIGDSQGRRKFRIEISKYEYVQGKEEAEIDDYLCYVYTLPMIAAEKLRAICQQMEGYTLMKYPRARARDFYDIYSIVTARRVDFSSAEFMEIVRHMFQVKQVPISFLTRIEKEQEFHAQDWPAVRDTIANKSWDFEFYFKFLVTEVKKLKPLWEE